MFRFALFILPTLQLEKDKKVQAFIFRQQSWFLLTWIYVYGSFFAVLWRPSTHNNVWSFFVGLPNLEAWQRQVRNFGGGGEAWQKSAYILLWKFAPDDIIPRQTTQLATNATKYHGRLRFLSTHHGWWSCSVPNLLLSVWDLWIWSTRMHMH